MEARLDKTLDRLEESVRGLRAELSTLRRDGTLATAAIVAAIVGTGILT
jgi:hypothetical protein